MKISIVIPALNEAGPITRAVVSGWQSGAEEVIVVDGGSSDETVSLASRLSATVIQSRAGRAYQQNAGAKLATGDVLLFLHADSALGAGCCSQIARSLRSPKSLAGGFRQHIEAPTLPFRLLEYCNGMRIRWRRSAYGDQGIFCRRDVFWDLGGFAEEPLLEDVLLMERLALRTKPILLPGPIYVSPRRWQQKGVLRQTILNWTILTRFWLGATPQELVRLYRRHDKTA